MFFNCVYIYIFLYALPSKSRAKKQTNVFSKISSYIAEFPFFDGHFILKSIAVIFHMFKVLQPLKNIQIDFSSLSVYLKVNT